MAHDEQVVIPLRIVIENPVAGVGHSLQAKDGHPLDAKRATAGEPLAFDFPVRVAPGPKFFGDQVRREGPVRRFVYIRVGQSAGDLGSPWSRRMKIDPTICRATCSTVPRRVTGRSRSSWLGRARTGRRPARRCGRRRGGWRDVKPKG